MTGGNVAHLTVVSEFTTRATNLRPVVFSCLSAKSSKVHSPRGQGQRWDSSAVSVYREGGEGFLGLVGLQSAGCRVRED